MRPEPEDFGSVIIAKLEPAKPLALGPLITIYEAANKTRQYLKGR